MIDPKFRLSKDRFKTWLEERSENVVGIRGLICDCPLARFFKTNGAKSINVTETHAYLDTLDIRLPQWAVDFICDVDHYPQQEIDGQTALTLLSGGYYARG